MTWGLEREIAERPSQKPSPGQFSRVFMGRLAKGERYDLTEQHLAVGGFSGLTTVVTVTATSSYTLVVGGIAHTVVAGSEDTKKTIAKKLMGLINKNAAYRAINLQRDADNYSFSIISQATFTLANTGTTTTAHLTVSAISGSGTAVAKGATVITLPFGIRGKIAAGQWVDVVAPNGFEHLARISTTAVDGNTTLNVSPLEQAIPAGSTFIYPVEFTNRTSANLNSSANWEGFQTFNSGGHEDAVPTGTSGEADLSGIYYDYSAGYRTAQEVFDQFDELEMTVVFGAPREGYTRAMKKAIIGLSGNSIPLEASGLINSEVTAKALTKIQTFFSVLDV